MAAPRGIDLKIDSPLRWSALPEESDVFPIDF